MNRKFYFFAVFALFFAAFQAEPIFAQEAAAPSEVQTYVKKRGGKKPTEINKYVTGDLNGDGQADAVAQYIIQTGAPGNDFTSYIAVFLNKGGKMVFASQIAAGSKLSGGLVPQMIDKGNVAVDRYEANAMEKTGTVYYKLVGKKLVKLQ